MKPTQILWAAMACLLLFFTAHPAAAQVPDTINYQGMLADDTGVPVPDGSYTMRFYLYDATTGGSQLWNSPDGEQQTVAVTNGVYDIQLGINQPLDSTIFDGGAAWLEVVVEGETLSPRQQITAAPFALKAGDADTLTGYALTDLDDRYVVHGETGAVDSNMITDGSVTSDDLGYDSVNASEIVAGAVRSSEVANNSLTAADLAIDSVTASEIADGAVGSSEIADGSVFAADLADGAALAEIADDDGPGSGLNADLLDGLSSSAFMTAGTDNWVNVAGDTMTGTLNLPANGLRVGTSQLVVTGGRVGLGTSSPNEQLEITGNLRLPATTSTSGILRSGSSTLIHRYGTRNFFAGVNAGNLAMTGNQNTGTGYYALRSNTEGEYNTATGAFSLHSNTEGLHNTANGYNALRLNTTGDNNTANGSSALRSNTTGHDTTANGYYALYANTIGDDNTASGSSALYSNTEGNYNTANGLNTLYANTTGSSNTANGYYALYSNTTGSQNTANGHGALRYSTTGELNTASGYMALHRNTIGNVNTAIGYGALLNSTSGYANTASGAGALGLNTTGDYNTASGYRALYSNTEGSYNTASGDSALYDNTTGEYNTASGFQALYDNTTGYRNTAIGSRALNANTTGIHGTALGRYAGAENITGNGNTLIGCHSDVIASDLINGTALGFGAVVTGSNRVRIGNTYVGQIGGNVGWSNLSDIRGKEDIEDITLGLDFINSLRPVEFRLIDGTGGLDLGFIAQDIETLLGTAYNILGIDEDSDRTLSLRYTDFIAPMVKAIQEQQGQIQEQQAYIGTLEKRLARIEAQLNDSR